MSEFDEDLGAWMGAQRERKSISQEAVATQMRLEQPTLSKIEHGRRRISAAELLNWAEAVGVPDYELHKALSNFRSTHFGSDRRKRTI